MRLCRVRISKAPKIAGWDPKFATEILGVPFGSFEPRRVFRWPEAQYACVC